MQERDVLDVVNTISKQRMRDKVWDALIAGYIDY
jgi:hypothetical protein